MRRHNVKQAHIQTSCEQINRNSTESQQICLHFEFYFNNLLSPSYKSTGGGLNAPASLRQLQLTWKTSWSNRREPKTVMPLLSTTGLLLRGRGLVICFLQSNRRVTFFFCTEIAMRCHLQGRGRDRWWWVWLQPWGKLYTVWHKRLQTRKTKVAKQKRLKE